MSISRIDQYQQALAAQLYGSQTALGQNIGAQGVNPQQKVKGVEGVAQETQGVQKFDWKKLNKLDPTLAGTQAQKGAGQTIETPAESIFAVNPFGTEKTAQQTTSAVPQNGGNQLFAALNAMDAKDIGLQGARNGLDGQKYLNLIA